MARTAASADDTLARAKELYASASYDEALALLDGAPNAAPVAETRSIAEYRVFCLLALDRPDEARKHIEGILRDNPLYVPSPDEASPRIQSVFRDVRKQALPKIVMERYAMAKASFERKDPQAGPQFDAVLALLSDPDAQAVPALTDLSTVVTAFRDLTTAMAAARPPEPAPVSLASVAKPFVINQWPSEVIYTVADGDVIPPVGQSQRMPQWLPSRNDANQEFNGQLELLIDAGGEVTSATMRTSVNAQYDRALLRAAKDWTFTPARRQETPVRYLIVIRIHLTPTPTAP